MTTDLYLHDLRRRLERRHGRALPVSMTTLARRLCAVASHADESGTVRRKLEQAGIAMRVACGARGINAERVELALLPGAPVTDQRLADDPLGRAVAATVVVRGREASGGAFVVSPAGLLVTAFHVVAPEYELFPRRAAVVFSDGRTARVDLFAGHPVLDFAIGWLPAGDWPAIPVGMPAALRYGQSVFAVGSPAADVEDTQGQQAMFRWTLTRGIVSHPRQVQDGIDWIQTDAAVDHGNSGGPLIDESGRAVGIVCRCYAGVRASGLALPIDYLASNIADALDAGRRACLAGRTCRFCGRWHADARVAHCRTCGVRWRASRA